MTRACDLLIIGAGPAGMRAAIAVAERGLDVVIADEGPGPGGQIYRNAATGPLSGAKAMGAEYARGRSLIERFAACSARRHFDATVFMIERQDGGGFLVGLVVGPGPALLFSARTLIVATGAHERPMPIPGWTLPAVMTAGAAQTMLKASAAVPDGPIVLAGMGPLLYLLAAQYQRLGVKIDALLDTTPAGNWRGALAHLGGFLLSPYAWKGLRLLVEVHRRTRVYRNISDLRAEGEDRLARVRFMSDGIERSVEAGVLLLHQGVVPQVNLAMAAGARHHWNDMRRAFEPERGALGESSVAGLFIAGDSGGIGGADSAEIEGALAAHGVLQRLDRLKDTDEPAIASLQAQLRSAMRGRRFLDALYRPSDAQLAPADDVVICRCEEVTAGEIRETIQRGVRGPNQAKAFTRAGMGPCQARMCGLTTTMIIATATGLAPDAVGYMRLRMPVKPVTVAQMAGQMPD